MTTLRLTVEYDGSEFRGFQRQPGVRTVAGVLEAALSSILLQPVEVTGAGRTDRGVHATGQVISVRTEAHFPFHRLALALNGMLPSDCTVREAAVAEEGFSARLDALERTYVYAILQRANRHALLVRYAHRVSEPLEVDAMRRAGRHLLGEHDFKSFARTQPGDRTVRELRRLQITTAGDLIRIEVAADGFLRHMVRTIVGSLVACGTGRRDPDEMPAILAACDRSAAGLTAPAAGLYLAGVRYGAYDSYAEPPVFGPGALRRLTQPTAFP
jgi:tRNA pseudouridine38-40 synthase